MTNLATDVAAMFDALLSGETEQREWANVAGEVMRLCQKHNPGRETWAAFESPERITGDAASEFGALLRDGGTGDSLIASTQRLSSLRVLALQLVDDAGADTLLACLRLFGLATAIDQERISGCVTRRPASRRVTLGTGDLIVRPDSITWAEHGMSTDMSKQWTRGFSRTRHLRLLSAGNYRVTVDNSAWELLDELFFENADTVRQLHCAVLQPHPDATSFDITFGLNAPGFGADRTFAELGGAIEEVRAAGGTSGGQLSGTFTNRGPVDARAAQATASRIVAEAVSIGVNVVLLPEYALSDMDDFERALEKMPVTKPTLVAAGVRREPTSGSGSVSGCQAWLCLPEGESEEPRVLSYDLGAKALPATYTHRRGDQPSEKVVLNERLSGGEVVLLQSARASVLALICRDALDMDLARMVEELSPSLLLVPAMSAKTAVIEEKATGVALDCQSMAIIGNGPPNWGGSRVKNLAGRHEAVFIRPSNVGPAIAAPSAVVPVPPDGELGFWHHRPWVDSEATWVPHRPGYALGTP